MLENDQTTKRHAGLCSLNAAESRGSRGAVQPHQPMWLRCGQHADVRAPFPRQPPHLLLPSMLHGNLCSRGAGGRAAFLAELGGRECCADVLRSRRLDSAHRTPLGAGLTTWCCYTLTRCTLAVSFAVVCGPSGVFGPHSTTCAVYRNRREPEPRAQACPNQRHHVKPHCAALLAVLARVNHSTHGHSCSPNNDIIENDGAPSFETRASRSI